MLQLQMECAGLGARKREEEERRGAQNSLRVFRQLPHSYWSRRRRQRKGLGGIKEILIYAGNAIDLDGNIPRQPRRLHRSPRRRVGREIASVNLVHLGELAHIL